MIFAEPIWLIVGLLFCCGLVALWIRYDRRQQSALATFAASHLHARLTASVSQTRLRWKRRLYFSSMILLFIALARPQAGYQWEEAKRRGIEILFAVDTSKSMLTPDIKPDRLTRAKLAVDDFVNRLDGDGVGLIAFAGNAFLQCPITLDYDAFNESLSSLDTTTISRGGTDISSAIQEAQMALQNRPSTDKILILLTDGEDIEGDAIDAAKTAAQSGLKIYTVGVGTANGDLIPLPQESGGGFVKDDSGQYVKSHLDEDKLQAIASATNGLYAPLGAQGEGLDYIYQKALAPLARHDLAFRQQRIFTERYQLFLVPSIFLLLASLLIGNRKPTARPNPETQIKKPRTAVSGRRRAIAEPVAALLAMGMLSLQSTAFATVNDAEKAYKKGDYSTAQKAYEDAAKDHPDANTIQFDAGAAAYKAGKYSQAAEDFQKSLDSKPSGDAKELAAQQFAYYNLGNTFYRNGQKTEKEDPQQTIQAWEQSVKAYDDALQLRGDDADAKFNRDFVQRKLDELKKQQPQNQQQQKQDDQKDQNSKQDQGQKDQTQQSQQNQQGQSGQGSPNDQNQNQASNQNGADKQQKDQQSPQDKGGQQQASAQKNDAGKPNAPQPAGQQPDQKQQTQDQAQAGDQNKPQQNQTASTTAGQTGQDQNGQKTGDEAQAQEQRVPGQMSKEEARQLLDSVKDEQKNMPGDPIARATAEHSSDQPIKDW